MRIPLHFSGSRMGRATELVLILLLLSLGGTLAVHTQSYSSSADPRLLLWLVPWGPGNGTYQYLIPYLPKVVLGVVFAFHTYGLGNQSVSLQEALSYDDNGQWISMQLSKLEAIYNGSDLVFVNILPTTTYWRGNLTGLTPVQLSLINYTLHQIAQVTNGGRKLVVGVSEMNGLSLSGYYEVYSMIRQVLPNAQLFYYTDLGQSVGSVESVFYFLQSNGIPLDYIGYDVFPYPSYNFTDGKIYIPGYYVQQIAELQSFAAQHGVSFFIGDVGFRDGDLEGYYNPASTSYVDFSPTVGYNATITFYQDVISQLSSMGINLIGIWDYDGSRGDPFGLWNNPDFGSLLRFVGITPVEAALVTVVSAFPYYYVNGSVHYSNKTYLVILPADLTFVRVDYLNGTARLLLTGVYGVANVSNSTVLIDRDGQYVIIASYVTQYYVTVSPQVNAYINGIRGVFASGWYDRGTKVVVFPQVVQVGQGEVYNVSRTFNYTVDYPMTVNVPYVVEYYVSTDLKSLPAIINGTNSTLVSGYYPEGTKVVIPDYYYLNGTARLAISASPEEFVVGSPVDVNASEALQWLVRIVLPNGTLEGWYNNGSIITLPRTVELNGTTYTLNETDNEVIITAPLVLHPKYVKSTSTTSGTVMPATATATTTATTSTSPSSPATSPRANPAVPYVLLTVLIAVAIVAVVILIRK